MYRSIPKPPMPPPPPPGKPGAFDFLIIIIIIIIYSIYGALIPNGPKALYIIKNNDKILNLQNYIVIL